MSSKNHHTFEDDLALLGGAPALAGGGVPNFTKPTPSGTTGPTHPPASSVAPAGFAPLHFSGNAAAAGHPVGALHSPGPAHLAIPQKPSLRWFKIAILTLTVVVLAAYAGFAYFFMDHFGFNSTVNGVDVSFMATQDVEGAIAAQVDNYTLSISGRDGQLASISGEQVGLRYVPDGQLERLLKAQSALLWPARLFTSDNAFTTASVELDESRLEEVSVALPFFDSAQMRPPIDAYLQFKDSAYVIVPEDPGTTLESEQARQLIRSALLATLRNLDLDAEGAYTLPAVLSTNPELAQRRETFNRYVPFSITYVLGDERVVLDAHTAINWVDRSGGGSGELDPTEVSNWIAEFAANHDTLGSTRDFINGYGQPKSVSGGTYGWQVDQTAEIEAIYAAVANRWGEEREPYLRRSAASVGVPDWGSTYVEVDMSEQHMWYFVDGACVLESDVITGLLSGGNATPEGVYTILDKKSPSVLRGPKLPEGGYEWESPVSYWMPVTIQGVGLHDATWQSSFGGQLYLTRGSHGCVNLPLSVAKQLYAQIETGTPVVLHF
ncbi:MAG: L,D-transpeptidase/peptidoglycan binding protein [Coriobacteriales bacterium]|nr:L,D-transpeptidase/peptidoglycan binding protein [Coriobacteriales bacterium]